MKFFVRKNKQKAKSQFIFNKHILEVFFMMKNISLKSRRKLFFLNKLFFGEKTNDLHHV